MDEHSRRMMVCADACSGIPTGALRDGVINEMVEVCRDVQKFLQSLPEDKNIAGAKEALKTKLDSIFTKIKTKKDADN